MKALNRRLLAVFVDHPRSILLVLGVLFALLAWQSTRFQIDASADTLLTKDNRLYLQSQVVNERFAPQEFLLLAYQPNDGDVFSETTRAEMRRLTESLSLIERVDTVRSIFNVPIPSLLEGGATEDIELESLTLENSDLSPDEMRQLLDGHPLYENLLINEDETALALQVTFQPNDELEQIESRLIAIRSVVLENRELTDAEQEELAQLQERAEPLRAALNEIRSEEIDTIRRIMERHSDSANLYLGGAQVLAYQLIEIIRSDLVIFGIAIGVIVCLLLLLLFRELRWVVIPLVCCAVSVLMTMGLFGLLELKATVISANFVALQLILTLAIVIHLIVQYRELQTENPQADHKELIRETLARKVAPCFYAGVTTSVGFATLLFSGLQPVVSFGTMMIVAVFVSIVASLVLFPCLLALFAGKGKTDNRSIASSLIAFFETVSLKARWLVALGSVLALGLSVVGALKLDVENSFINYFSKSTQVHQELAFIDKEFGGTTPLDLIYTIPDYEKKPQLVISADTVASLQRIQTELRKFEAIGKTLSLVNLAEVAKAANDGKPLTEYEVTALYLTLDEALRDSLLGAFFSTELGQVRFSIRIQDSTEGLDRNQLLRDIGNAVESQGVSKENYTMTGLFVLYEDILQRLFESQILTLGIVFVALSVTFLIIFRSWRVALIAIAPNVLSTLLVLGVMGWLGIPLDLMTITIAAIAMGIAVDDTIHYVHRYREEIETSSPNEALKNTHRSVGYAILYTSIVIVLGFSMLSFSDFVPSVLFGLLTGLSMCAAVVFDLSILPILLHRFVPRRGSPKSAEGSPKLAS